MVTFGVVPAVAMVQVLVLLKTEVEWLHAFPLAVYVPLSLALFSALRLAKFNIDTRQSDSFIGLPTPANGLFWMAWGVILMPGPICFCMERPPEAGFLSDHWMAHPAVIIAGSAVFSLLMVANLPLLALKFKHFGWAGNELRYVFAVLAIAALAAGIIIYGTLFAGIPAIILLYLLISVIGLRTKPQQ
jgi:CDP-diacylglycerol---serine O-phosphatidyltransferase